MEKNKAGKGRSPHWVGRGWGRNVELGVWTGLTANVTLEQRPGGEEVSHLDVGESVLGRGTSWRTDLKVGMCPAG